MSPIRTRSRAVYDCTKRGGLGMHLIPFLFPFHASPSDFQRYTHRGLSVLFKQFHVLTQTNPTGPVSLALVCSIEFLSILLGFGSERLKALWTLLLSVGLFPIKFLDAPFVNRSAFYTLAPTLFVVLQKGDSSARAEPTEHAS